MSILPDLQTFVNTQSKKDRAFKTCLKNCKRDDNMFDKRINFDNEQINMDCVMKCTMKGLQEITDGQSKPDRHSSSSQHHAKVINHAADQHANKHANNKDHVHHETKFSCPAKACSKSIRTNCYISEKSAFKVKDYPQGEGNDVYFKVGSKSILCQGLNKPCCFKLEVTENKEPPYMLKLYDNTRSGKPDKFHCLPDETFEQCMQRHSKEKPH